MSATSKPGGQASPMLELVAQLPDQLAHGLRLAAELPQLVGVERVVVCGMGGSAAAAELARGVFREAPAAIDVCRTYRLPGAIGASTLLVFSSYSGNTEETLAAYDQDGAGPLTARRVAICSGGELAQRARRDGIPVVLLPEGLPPRASLGLGVGALFRLLECCGIARDVDAQIEEAAAVLRTGNDEYGPQAPVSENPARQLARRLYGKLPLLYAAAGLTEAVAWRWKTQINENAKAMAYVGVLPELDHNEIVGWDSAVRLREDLFVVALRDRQDHPRIQRRFTLTREVLGERVRGWESFESRGQGPTARALSLVQLGDYLSVYLAAEYGVDPMPVEPIERLKQRLADQL
jgi:glucose/mannose-6-phosphate isomerase